MKVAPLGSAKPGLARITLPSVDASSEQAGQDPTRPSLLHSVPWDHKRAQSITLKIIFRSEPTRVSRLLESTASL